MCTFSHCYQCVCIPNIFNCDLNCSFGDSLCQTCSGILMQSFECLIYFCSCLGECLCGCLAACLDGCLNWYDFLIIYILKIYH